MAPPRLDARLRSPAVHKTHAPAAAQKVEGPKAKPASSRPVDQAEGLEDAKAQPKSLDEIWSPGMAALLKGSPASNGFACASVEVPRVQRALGIVSQIDVLSPADKKQWGQAMKLYENAFPSADEREDPKLIKSRIESMERIDTDPRVRAKFGDSRFHVLTAKDKHGDVVGYFQFSLLPVGKDKSAVYGQYYAVADDQFMRKAHHRDENPRNHGVMSALYVAAWNVAKVESAAQGRRFLGSIHESEMKGQGPDDDSRKFTETRLGIHNRAGARVLMLENADGSLHTPHIQPALSDKAQPLRLHFMVRPASFEAGDEKKAEGRAMDEMKDLSLAFLENFRREGFDEKQVKAAESTMKHLFADAKKVVLLPAEQVPSYASLAAAEPALGKQFKADFEDDAKQLGLLAHAPPAKAVAPPRTEVVNYL